LSPRTVACKHCGALNEREFERCIRCGEGLHDADPAAGRRRVPARRVRRSGAGPGAEALFGKYPPEQLPVAKTLVMLNALVFVAQTMGALSRGGGTGGLLLGGNALEGFLFGALPQPHPAWTGLDPVALAVDEPWRFLSACFVHYGVLHVGLNMFWLIRLSQAVEPILGSVRLLIAYVVSGIAGYVASFGWALFFSGGAITAGASGAVFGVMGMLLGVSLRRNDPQLKRRILETVVFAVFIGFLIPVINNAAHIGGVVAGTAFGLAFAPGAPQPSRPWQRGLAAVAFLACLASIVAPRLSPLYEPIRTLIEQDHLEQRYD
jgi:rhomboid protease GluP